MKAIRISTLTPMQESLKSQTTQNSIVPRSHTSDNQDDDAYLPLSFGALKDQFLSSHFLLRHREDTLSCEASNRNESQTHEDQQHPSFLFPEKRNRENDIAVSSIQTSDKQAMYNNVDNLPKKSKSAGVPHVYHDFADFSGNLGGARKKKGGVTQPFPEKMMELLREETDCPSVVSWLPHGRSFIVRNPKVFTSKIMPKVSFLRTRLE
jgi:HSF-type DNA-binding